ncbi:MAG TPA: helix-turn-helix transcriptional regulator [Microlunatus sp.]|nr:helix-turn-helix transcriptional regulator [Microlunatus sp.]
MTDAAGVLVGGFATRESDAGWEFLERTYTLQPVRLFGDAASYRLDSHYWSAGRVGYIQLLHSMGFITHSEPFSDMMAVLIRRGSLTIKSRHQQVTIGPGEVGVYLPLVDLQFIAPTIGVECVRLPLSELSTIAAERVGIDPHDFRLEGMTPVSAAKARYWRSLLDFVGREISARSSALASELVQVEVTRMVAASAITVFPNTALRVAHATSPGRVEPAALRRAIAFVDANAERPITVQDMAAAASTTPRALQHAFARHRDTTPTGYLRRVRLEHAHRELQAADPTDGTTVGSVAARWGFISPGRFAAQYHETYGTLPSHTLRT